MMKNRALLITAGVLSLTGPVIASAQAPAFWTDYRDHLPGYLSSAQDVEARRFLPPPPPAGGVREAADFSLYLETRKLEGSARWRLAAADAEVDTPAAPFKAFACALNADITPQTAPHLTRLLGRVLPDIEIIQRSLKAEVRERPYVRDPQTLCVPGAALSRSSSYPSGHAAIGFAWALILSELTPGRQEAVTRRGIAYGESRVVCGFHYVSDIEAGRAMGAALIARYHSLPAFAEDWQAVRQEWQRISASVQRPDPETCTGETAAIEAVVF